jgi:hypothetical protein
VHPWLFEHRDKKRIRAIFHTFIVSQLPRRFWESVRPTHRVRPVRLMVYWAIVSTFLLLILGMTQTPWIQSFAYSTAQNGTGIIGSIWMFISDIAEGLGDYWIVLLPRHVLLICGAFLAWPWLTLLTHAVFRQTMSRARIKPEHVLRCLVYTADASVLLVIGMLWVLSTRAGTFLAWSGIGILLSPVATICLLFCEAVLTYRMIVAWRRYLAFPDAIATCLACQFIVSLAMFTFYLCVVTYRM